MKRVLLLLLCLVAYGATWADVTFNPTTKYRLSCKYYNNGSNTYGSVVLGAKHNSMPELYYLTTSTYSDDSWWYIRANGSSYEFINAESGQRMAYTSNRVNGRTKGLTLTTTSSSQTLWNIKVNSSNYASIESNYSGNVFNLRTDGSYLLGTYNSDGTGNNELFKIYDEKGNDVLAGETGGAGGGDVTPNYTSGSYGTNSNNEYWELTHLSQPVVYTTNISDPVLYSIINLRSSRYVGVGTSYKNYTTCLTEETNASNKTQFYFVQSGNGVQVFTKDGQYVSTSFAIEKEGTEGLSVVSGQPQGNIWGFAWNVDVDYTGYTLQKLDNLNATDNTQSENTCWNDYQVDWVSGAREVGLYTINDPGSGFVFTSSDIRHAQLLKQQGIDLGIDFTPKSIATALDSFLLGDKQVPYESYNKTYYYPLPESVRGGGDFTTSFRYTLAKTLSADDYKLTINETEPDAGGNITFARVNCNRTYPIELSNADGSVKLTASLRFTFLPVVEVNDDYITTSYTKGSLRVTFPKDEGLDSIYHADFKIRGASSTNYPKKSYAVKLRDAEGNSIDRKLLGLRSDNNWILDAMYVDLACMRNRVCTDLWNDFAVKPYYADREKKVRTGTRGKFVEMILNGRHNGIYCMTEKMDRKQLKLKKFVPAAESTTGEDEVHGLLYKSSSWSYETFMGHEQGDLTFPYKTPSSYNNYLGNETWRSYEFKYPDYQKEAVDWEPLYNAVNHVAAVRSQTAFDEGFETYFDYPMMRDYYLFLELIMASDNHGKNMLFYVYDKQGPEGGKIAIAPWDLDGTLGQRWDGSTSYTGANQEFDEFINKNEHGQFTPFLRLKLSSKYNWKADLTERYAELRNSKLFDADAIANRVATYASLFEESKADMREQNRWTQNHSDLQSAASYIESWIKRRVAFLDNKYGYEPTTTQINEAVSEAHFSAQGGQGQIGIGAGKAQIVRIYTTAGALVRTEQVPEGFTALQGFAPGIYIVNGQKVIVE